MESAHQLITSLTLSRTRWDPAVGRSVQACSSFRFTERLAAAGVAVNPRYNDLESDPDEGAAVAKVLAEPGYAESAAQLTGEFNRSSLYVGS